MMLEIKKQKFPNINLNVELDNSETAIQKVLNGDADFGFITKDI
tara:strand:+ start:915 stop:1046 length:132 start_codon:yes stop_codon:yes gene_type:complete